MYIYQSLKGAVMAMQVLNYFDYVFTGIFTIEILLKVSCASYYC